jgi:hypothetical protein
MAAHGGSSASNGVKIVAMAGISHCQCESMAQCQINGVSYSIVACRRGVNAEAFNVLVVKRLRYQPWLASAYLW